MNQIKFTGVLLSLLIITALFSCSDKKTDDQAQIDSLKNELHVLIKKRDLENTNKKLVADMYQELFGDKNLESIDKYLDEQYIQHNPILPDGRDTLKKAAALWFKGAPKEKVDIRHLAADSNLVFIHTRSQAGNRVSSIIDIYRIENNKIVEHWDVIQSVPEKSANPHPMF
ncbi:MAG: ester cyclase [Bacteroidota bacterium]